MASSIASTILQGGRDQAEGQLRLAEIEAQRRRGNAETWGRSIATLADVFGNLPKQIREQKVQAQNDELRGVQLEGAKLNLEGAKTDAARAQKLSEIQQTFGSNPDTFEKALRSNGFTDEADKIHAGVTKQVMDQLDLSSKRTNNTLASTKLATSMLNGVSDESTLQGFRAAVPALFPDKETQAFVLAQLDGPYNPKKIETAKQLGMSQSEVQGQQDAVLRRTTQQLQNTKTVAETHQVLIQNAADLLASSTNPQNYAQHLAFVQRESPEIAGLFGKDGTPADIAAAKKIAIGPVKGAELGIQQQNANRMAATAAAANGGGTGGLDPDAVAYTATQYRILGPQGIPTRIGEADKTHIINEAARQTKALGQSPAQAVQKQAAFKADASSLTKITLMASAAEAFENKAIAQADLVKNLSAKVGRSAWPIVNGVLLSGKEATGDTDTHLFANALLTFTTEYAKLMEGSTGSVAGSSEGARRDAAKLISTALNKGTIDKTIDQMQWEMRQTREGYRVTLDHIADRMGAGAGPNGAATQTPPPANPKTGDTWQSPTGPTKWNGTTWGPS